MTIEVAIIYTCYGKAQPQTALGLATDAFLAQTPAMRRLMEKVHTVAPFERTVLRGTKLDRCFETEEEKRGKAGTFA